MRRFLWLVRWSLVAVLIVIASALQAQNVATFDVPNSTYTHPVSINQAGQITGDFVDANGQQHSFVRERDGTLTTFDVPDSNDGQFQWHTYATLATSINAAGRIAGYYYLDTVPPNGIRWHGFVRDRNGTFTTFAITDFVLTTAINPAGEIIGSFDSGKPSPRSAFLRAPDGSITEFEAPNATYTYATAINQAGLIVGQYYYYADATAHGFLRARDGTFITFDVSNSTFPTAIDPKGQTSGFYADGSYFYHGFLRGKDGTVATFDVTDSTNTLPAAMNAVGQIAGVYLDASYHHHAFLREKDGTFVTFDVPNATETYPTSMNAAGRITGWYSDASGVHGFVRRGVKKCVKASCR
jgi:hypothetical protein